MPTTNASCSRVKSAKIMLLLVDRRSLLLFALASVDKKSTGRIRGAAELDAEYYLRGALNLDKDRDIFDKREPLKGLEDLPDRELDADFAAKIFNAAGQRQVTASSSLQAEAACEAIYQSLDRKKAEALGDALRTALLPSSIDESVSVRQGAQSLVDTFAAARWIESGTVQFADGDDEDDDPRPIQVTLKNPVTATVAAKLEKRGVIYHPDFTGLCLASYFRRRGLSGQFDEYLLDDTYRSDPRAFQASSTLLLFQLLEY